MNWEGLHVVEHALGRIVEHDPRSRNFAFSQAPKQKSVTHAIYANALDQKNLGSCTGNAAAQWLNTIAAKRNRQTGVINYMLSAHKGTSYMTEEDAVALYSTATKLDEDATQSYPPVDCGSSGLGIAKALLKYGFIAQYRHTFSFSDFQAAVEQQPVIVGTNWYDSMFEPDDRNVIQISTNAQNQGGHEYLIRGISWKTKRFRIRNSWGTLWGLQGDAYIPFGDMERLLSEEGDATILGLF